MKYLLLLLAFSSLIIIGPISNDNALQKVQQFYEQAAFTEALKLATNALSKLPTRPDKSLQIDLLAYQSASMIMLYDYEQALQQLDKAEALLPNNKRGLRRLRVRNLQAKAYLAMGNCHQTKAILDENISQFQDKTTDNELAHTYDYLGTYWGEIGDHELARTYFIKAHEVRLKNRASKPLAVHETIEYLALLEHARGNYDQAIQHLLEGLKIVESHQGNYLQRAIILRDLGVSYREKGDSQTALEYLEAARELLMDHQEDALIKLAQCYQGLGATFRLTGQLDQSRKNFEKAQQLLETDGRHALKSNLGFLLHDFALLKIDEKAFDRAEEMLTKAATLIQSDFQGCAWFINQATQIRSTKADLLYYRNKSTEAVKEYQRIIRLIKDELGPNSTFLWQPYNNLGLTYAAQSKRDSAMIAYDQALDLMHPAWRQLDRFEEAISPVDFSYILWNKAENQYWNFGAGASIDSLKRSFQYFDAYARFLDYMRGSYLEEVSKIGFANLNKIAYEKCLGALYTLDQLEPDAGWDRKTFTYLERSKSLVLLEAVKRSQVEEFKGISQTRLAEEKALRSTALQAENRYQDLLARLGEKNEFVTEAKAQSFQAKRAFYSFRDQLKKDHPEYAGILQQVDIQTLDNLQSSMQHPKQGVLAYYEGATNIYIFLITAQDYRYALVRKDFPIVEWIDDFRQGITGYHSLPISERNDSLYRGTLRKYVSKAKLLYDSLLRPIEQGLSGIEELVIIPDGHLANIPFEALLSDTPGSIGNFDSYPFLLRRFQISYCYSASLLDEMVSRKYDVGNQEGVLGMAPFSIDLTPKGEKQTSRDRVSNLKYSAEEVDFIVQKAGGLALKNKQATKARFLEESADYRMLHISSHALADAQDGTQSYLAFYADEGFDPLYVRELYGLNLQADLVVLSACETNIGQLEMGEGIISLARAFAYAGAKSILTTLWVVDDAAMKDQTIHFYQELQKPAIRKDEALQLAKRWTLQNAPNIRKHPYFWAAMIAVGDMASISL